MYKNNRAFNNISHAKEIEIMNKNSNTETYNNCFTLGAKCKTDDERIIKVPCYIDAKHGVWKLCDGKDGKMKYYYEMPYEEAAKTLSDYMNGDVRRNGDESLRVSLYLDNAKFGKLYVFVIDFDEWDENSEFFKGAKEIADKVTRSQGGGYHMFFGIDKEKATPLFDSINLLASKLAKSFVNKTGEYSLDGKNKVDMFCDARHFIYEWEVWDNEAGLTDRTEALYELLKANFEMKRPMDFDEWEDADCGTTFLEGASEPWLKSEMDKGQEAVFEDLKTMSSDCPRNKWFRIGVDIYHVFDEELGGKVFLWWSKPGHSYNPESCARTWGNICKTAYKTRLYNSEWDMLIWNNTPSAF